jgi:hypothetical protein
MYTAHIVQTVAWVGTGPCLVKVCKSLGTASVCLTQKQVTLTDNKILLGYRETVDLDCTANSRVLGRPLRYQMVLSLVVWSFKYQAVCIFCGQIILNLQVCTLV